MLDDAVYNTLEERVTKMGQILRTQYRVLNDKASKAQCNLEVDQLVHAPGAEGQRKAIAMLHHYLNLKLT